MLQVLETIYACLFVIAAVQGTRTAIELAVPRWLVLLSTVAYALGTAGMLLHLSATVAPGLASVWRYVVGLLVVQLAVELIYEWRSGISKRLGVTLDGGAQARSLATTGTALALLFALPMIWMNVSVALGGA